MAMLSVSMLRYDSCDWYAIALLVEVACQELWLLLLALRSEFLAGKASEQLNVYVGRA